MMHGTTNIKNSQEWFSLKKASAIYTAVSLQSIISHLSYELSFGTFCRGFTK